MAELLTLNVAGPTVLAGEVSVPDPTADAHAASKGWVEAAIAAALGGMTPASNNDRYWGAIASASLNSAGVLALAGHDTTASKSKSATLSPSAQFVFFAYPARLGPLASILVDGVESFPADFEAVATVSVTPVGGVAEDYYVYRTTNALSATLPFVWS